MAVRAPARPRQRALPSSRSAPPARAGGRRRRVTTSSSDARKPRRHSFRTNSSRSARTSLVTNPRPLPARRAARRAPRRRPASARRRPRRSRRGPAAGGRRTRRGGRAPPRRIMGERPILPPVLNRRSIALLAASALALSGVWRLRRRQRHEDERGRDDDRDHRDHARDDREADSQGRRRPQLHRGADHELRGDRDPARREAFAEDGRELRLPRSQGLLRQADLPPHRQEPRSRRLRHPGRRPAGDRAGRAGLHRGGGAAALHASTSGAWWRWPRPRPRRPAPRAASSSS